MTTLLTYEYFTSGRAVIYNLTGSGTIETARRADLDVYIYLTEKNILTRLLGDDLYDAFIAGLAASPIAARWTALKNQLVDETNKLSPLVAFVYHKWMQDKATINAEDRDVNSGELQTNVLMIVDLYNTAIDDMDDVWDWLTENSDDYPEWEGESTTFEHINVMDI